MRNLSEMVNNKEITRDEFFKRAGNRYEEAIMQKREIDFLLGREEFFYIEQDSGKHYSLLTMYGVFGYSQKYGNQKMLEKFNSDIYKVLKTDISVQDLFIITNYVYLYNISYLGMLSENPSKRDKENNVTVQWILSDEIKNLFTIQYKKNKKLYGHLSKDDFRWISEDPGYGFFLYQIEAKLKIIKEKFDIDLLLEK